MPRRQKRKRRRIHNPHPLHPKHPRPAIHHRALLPLLPHRARRRGVIDRIRALHQHLPDLRIRAHILPRKRLFANRNLAHGGGIKDLPRAPEGLDREIHVSFIAQQVWVNDGVGGGGGAVDSHVAPAEGSYEYDYDGSVVFAVAGRVEEEIV